MKLKTLMKFKCVVLIGLLSFPVAVNAQDTKPLIKPLIKSFHFDSQVANCYEGSSFWINADNANADTRIQYQVPQAGAGFLTSLGDIGSTGSKSEDGKFFIKLPCPSSPVQTELVVRLYQESTGATGNQIRLPLSSGPMPILEESQVTRYETSIVGRFLQGKLKVYRDGSFVGEVYNSNPNKFNVLPSLHKTYSGNFTLENDHGESSSIFVQPFNLTRVSISNSPTLSFEYESEGKCRYYKMREDKHACNILLKYGLLNVSNPELLEYPDSSDEVDIYIPLERRKNYRDVAILGGYATYVEFAGALDYYQLKKYPAAYQEYNETDSLAYSDDGYPTLIDYYPVPIYSGIYQGERSMTLNARTTIAAELALLVSSNIDNADVLVSAYNKILQLPSMGNAVSRYTQLLSVTIPVDYKIPRAIVPGSNTVLYEDIRLNHKIISPLKYNDSVMTNAMQKLYSEYMRANLYE